MRAGLTSATIDREECISCGSCYAECPEFFEENEDDFYSQVIAEYRIDDDPALGMAPEPLAECVQAGADVCPVEMIHVGE